MKKQFAAFVTALLVSSPLMAAPFVYAPENCDFQVGFPEKPFIEKKCSGDKCDEIVTYTQTKNASSLNVRVVCRPAQPAELKGLDAAALKSAIDKMVKDAGVTAFAQDGATLDGNVLSSVALATGKRNDRDVLYTGQIWVGAKSVFTLEAEMTGPQDKEIDRLYGDILKTIATKEMAARAAKEETAKPQSAPPAPVPPSGAAKKTP